MKKNVLQNMSKMLEPNTNLSIRISLTIQKILGFWAPRHLSRKQRFLYDCYTGVSFMFLIGTYLIIQVVDMYHIWGDLSAMTGNAFLLFTNVAQSIKLVNLFYRRRAIEKIIGDSDEALRGVESDEETMAVKRCIRETARDQLVFVTLTTLVVSGWASSAEEGNLPLRAWYPYDTTVPPAYELTYLHQIFAIFIAAYLNVSKDTLYCSLVAQTKCRLKILKLALSKITNDLEEYEEGLQVSLLSHDADAKACHRLRDCAMKHQMALATAAEIEECFSAPTLAQFSVSLLIICVTAFQMASQTGNMVRVMSMAIYLLNMMFQVFLYCYHGNDLREEAADVLRSAYDCNWYRCSKEFRSSLLVLMRRSFRPLTLTAGGFATLSLETFMALIKASYSFFTVLQQAHEDV